MKTKKPKILGLVLALIMFFTNLPFGSGIVYAETGDVEINDAHFPDENFKNYVKKNFDKDGNNILSQKERDAVTSIAIKATDHISDLTGIEHFNLLSIFICNLNNQLTKLDLSKNTKLTELYCTNNQLTNLDVTNNTSLTKLYCYNNQLTKLDVSKNTSLTELSCSGNKLTNLDVTNNKSLTVINCIRNKLTNLDISKNTSLTYINCSENQLTNLDLTNNNKLTELYCGANQLTDLDVTNNTSLTKLYCSNNQLTNLDVSKNTKLTEFYCFNNRLTNLDVSKNTSLVELSCAENQLTKLDVSKNTSLTYFICAENQLTKLDVSKNTELIKFSCVGNRLTKLDVSKNTSLVELSCAVNQLTNLDVSKNTSLTEINCWNNRLTNLDVSNLQLVDFNGDNQEYNIKVIKGIREFNYIKFPGQFNKDKVDSPDGASFGNDFLTVDNDTINKVTYNYKVNNDSVMSVTLNVIYEDKPTQRPSTTVILTLDESHRGGEITNIEVEEGDLIEPHLYIPRRRGYIFRGWSYDRKHLDEVKPGDRIYTNTVLYAIWKRAEEERVEEPEEIKGEDHKAYIFGYPNGTVRPNGSITRAEAAAMLARLLNIEAIGSAAKPQFTDTESSWYNKAINAIVARGIMKGYPDGRFRPNAPITRAEFTQMISTIDNKPYGVAPFADVPGHWAERAIGSEYQAKRITGYPDGLFRPDANITRAEAAVILNKIFERNFDAMSLAKCKNILLLKRFIDLDETFWGYNDMVEATNTHEYIRRYKGMVPEDWLLIK